MAPALFVWGCPNRKNCCSSNIEKVHLMSQPGSHLIEVWVVLEGRGGGGWETISYCEQSVSLAELRQVSVKGAAIGELD